MKMIIIYNNHCFYKNKIVDHIKNQVIQVIYIDKYQSALHKLYRKNNLIVFISSLENLLQYNDIRNDNYSLDVYTIKINNKNFVIDETTAYNKYLHESLQINSFKTEINMYILYHNLIYYNLYILLLSFLLFVFSYYCFHIEFPINISNRYKSIKQFL